MTTGALLVLLLAQAPPPAAPPPTVRTTLVQLRRDLDKHKPTFGAAPPMTAAKHQLRDWIERQLEAADEHVDARTIGDTVHAALGRAGLLCADFLNECDTNQLGYVDEVRVRRQGDALTVVTSMGVKCGWDESAYVYTWQGRWRRAWQDEQTAYTERDYHPQLIHDVQVSSDGNGGRLVVTFGSQAMCSGAFKDVYARAWQLGTEGRAAPILNWKAQAADAYPPIQGRSRADGVLFQYTAGGRLSGDVHAAVRQFAISPGKAVQVDPIAPLPRDFVLEWLAAPWAESRARSASSALEAAHAALHKDDGVGDFPSPTLRCASGEDLWQVKTQLFEGPTRYYRVRWQLPYTFTLVDVSETPYADCTVADDRANTYPGILNGPQP